MTLIEILEAREEALNVQEVAELLGVSDKHIYEMAADGTLPAFKVGRSVRFDPQDLADWLRKKKPPDEQHSLRQPQKLDGGKSNRSEPERISAAHIWRNKISSLDVALEMSRSPVDDSMNTKGNR